MEVLPHTSHSQFYLFFCVYFFTIIVAMPMRPIKTQYRIIIPLHFTHKKKQGMHMPHNTYIFFNQLYFIIIVYMFIFFLFPLSFPSVTRFKYIWMKNQTPQPNETVEPILGECS